MPGDLNLQGADTQTLLRHAEDFANGQLELDGAQTKDLLRELARVAASADAEVERMKVKFKTKMGDLEVRKASALAMLDDLQGTKAYLDRVIAAMTDSLLVVDASGNLRKVNQAFLDLVKTGEKDALGTPFAQFLRAGSPSGGEWLKRLVAEGHVQDIEMEFVSKDGETIPISFCARTLNDRSGNMTEIVCVARDMTNMQALIGDLRRANQEIQEAQKLLVRKEKLAAVGQLAASVGHELRNPLGAVQNAFYYVEQRVQKTNLTAEDPRVGKFLVIIRKELETCTKIIEDLLDFARERKLEVQPVKVEDWIGDSLSVTKVAPNVRVLQELHHGKLWLEADPRQIRQVLVNLIKNALEAMPDGGTLTLRTAPSKLDAGKSAVALDLVDTGVGMTLETQGKIFEPLFTTKVTGTGLGMPIVQQIVLRHEGKIAVQSELGKGTRVTVTLPAAAGAV